MNSRLKVISLFFAVLILANAFSLIIIRVNYELNKDFIAANFCVNTDKPQMSCHGQCHMKKQLKEATKESSKKSTRPSLKLELEYLSQIAMPSIFVSSYGLKLNLCTQTNTKLRYYYPSIDKPPC